MSIDLERQCKNRNVIERRLEKLLFKTLFYENSSIRADNFATN